MYRVVGGVFIIAITRAGANTFAALNLVSAVTRLLCAECKTVDLTAARILKRYAQVGGRDTHRWGTGGRAGGAGVGGCLALGTELQVWHASSRDMHRWGPCGRRLLGCLAG